MVDEKVASEAKTEDFELKIQELVDVFKPILDHTRVRLSADTAEEEFGKNLKWFRSLAENAKSRIEGTARFQGPQYGPEDFEVILKNLAYVFRSFIDHTLIRLYAGTAEEEFGEGLDKFRALATEALLQTEGFERFW